MIPEFSKKELDGEIWQDIPSYEGYYQASNLGRIRGLDRVIECKNGFDCSQIIKCCKGKAKTHKNFKWEYVKQ